MRGHRFKYGVAKSLCNGDVFQALRGNSIPSYLAYTLDGRNTIRDLISTVVWHYIPLRTCKRLRMALKRSHSLRAGSLALQSGEESPLSPETFLFPPSLSFSQRVALTQPDDTNRPREAPARVWSGEFPYGEPSPFTAGRRSALRCWVFPPQEPNTYINIYSSSVFELHHDVVSFRNLYFLSNF